ncbi:hypothetical protein U9M48_006968 [Paspalum notatum var. saurae]|uniref:Uncharacterized protein n=1 Tax=Paspalum notatum var. saurae TaxID=547442 RepID=A0AAQ3Q107_PASNO
MNKKEVSSHDLELGNLRMKPCRRAASREWDWDGPASRPTRPPSPTPESCPSSTCSVASLGCSLRPSLSDPVGGCGMGAKAEGKYAAAEEGASINQRTLSIKGGSSSMEKVYAINSPLKKRKSQCELIDPRLLSLKYKFRNRLSCQEDEPATTVSLGYDGIFMNKNSGTDMVSIPEELDSCENTLSLFGGCFEVDSKNGIQDQCMRKMFEVQTSASSSSSNNFSSEAFSSHSSGTRETDSLVMHDVEHDHPDYMLQPHSDDLERIYDVLEQYDDLMKDELIDGDVYCSAAHIVDEKLYSNGVDDFQILPTGQTGYHISS